MFNMDKHLEEESKKLVIKPGVAYEDHDIFKFLCKATKKWGLYILFGEEEEGEDVLEFLNRVEKDSGGLVKRGDSTNAFFDGYAYFLYDTEEEMRDAYNGVSGKDSGGVVYALTCSNGGVWLTENT